MKDKLNLMYGLKFDTFNDNIESMIRHINNYGEQVSLYAIDRSSHNSRHYDIYFCKQNCLFPMFLNVHKTGLKDIEYYFMQMLREYGKYYDMKEHILDQIEKKMHLSEIIENNHYKFAWNCIENNY